MQKKGKPSDNCRRYKLIHKLEIELAMVFTVFSCDNYREKEWKMIIELQNENQQFEKPEWIGIEVTRDTRYFNANLIRQPYRMWRDKS